MKKYSVESYSFSEIVQLKQAGGADIIAAIKRIAKPLFRKSAKDDGKNYLKDRIKYESLINCDYSVAPDFGRVFLAREESTKQYAGFVLGFDDLFIPKKYKGRNDPTYNATQFPISHCEAHFQHDIPYLMDLVVLADFAYCFQIGVLPQFQGTGCADVLLDAYELFYIKKEIVLMAASVHESQKRIIWRLQARNKNQQRHHAKDGELGHVNFTYHFLDHYFDEKQEERLWFRIIQIVDNRRFIKKINYFKLPKAYKTIIPIQLNQAVVSVNNIIKHIDAKLVWSSFFNANNLLLKRYGMGKDNHGFFNSLLEASSDNYDFSAAQIRKITAYLKDKVNPRVNVASLTDSFRDQSYELFFFKEEVHEMKSFANARVLSLADAKTAIDTLLHKYVKDSVFRTLFAEEKNDWIMALQRFLENPSPENGQTWMKWKNVLDISEDEEESLRFWVSSSRLEKDKKAPFDKMAYKAGKQLVKKINQERKVLAHTTYEQWMHFLELHKVLYRIDASALDNPEDYWWCHAMVPINYSQRKNVVGIMFTFLCKKLPKSNPEHHSRMNDLANLIASALSKNMLNILIKFQENYAIENGNRFVTAAVTSRNLAHNLGSHILANLDSIPGVTKIMSEMSSSFTEELARFNGFIRTKTHQVADMIMSEPVSTVDKWLFKEVIHQFNAQKIVKRFLSGTKVTNIDVHYIGTGPTREDDVKIQVPNSDLGVAAFSMILENIVRNSAKYELQQGAETLDLSVEVFRQNERGYFVRIYDHIHRPQPDLKDLVVQINGLLAVKNFLSDHQIRQSGWGLTEMKAAAAYMQKKVLGAVLAHEEKMNTPFITAHRHTVDPAYLKSNKPIETLAYEVYLKRPRNILIVNHKQAFSGLVSERYKILGIKVIPPEVVTSVNKGIYSHQFIVCFDKGITQKVQNLKRFPLRWILLDGKKAAQKLKETINTLDDNELITYFWKLWMRSSCARKEISLNLDNLYVLRGLNEEIIPQEVNPKELIIYDDHARNIPSFFADRKNEFTFYHSFTSINPFGRIIHNNQGLDAAQHEAFSLKLYEAAITKIIIVDERIQRDILKQENTNGSFFNTLRLARVFVPNPVDDDAPDLLDWNARGLLENWFSNKLPEFKADFIMLHLGLLESIIDPEIRLIDEWIDKNIRAIDPGLEIVIISGRGKPHNFPSSISFQPANVISEYMSRDNFSKYHLVQILFSSRTRVGI